MWYGNLEKSKRKDVYKIDIGYERYDAILNDLYQ